MGLYRTKLVMIIIKNWIFYLMAAAVITGLKYFYSRAGSDELRWILAPTAWWAGTISGLPFEYEPGVGYINYSIRFIIAASCSGVQFMVIAIATLIFSFVHRMNTTGMGFGWAGLSLGFAYLYTIFVNGLRIVLSIYLPSLLRGQMSAHGWLNPGRLHTLIGVTVYFTSLLMAYQAAEFVSRKMAEYGGAEMICADQADTDHSDPQRGRTGPAAPRRTVPAFPGLPGRKCIPPLFWYCSIVLGIPFLNSAYRHNSSQFSEYVLLIAAVCSGIVFLYCLVSAIIRHI